jgi:hypothetical protein
MLPDDDPNGPKHVEAIWRDILSVSCSILCFNKECICWQKNVEHNNPYYDFRFLTQKPAICLINNKLKILLRF